MFRLSEVIYQMLIHYAQSSCLYQGSPNLLMYAKFAEESLGQEFHFPLDVIIPCLSGGEQGCSKLLDPRPITRTPFILISLSLIGLPEERKLINTG